MSVFWTVIFAIVIDALSFNYKGRYNLRDRILFNELFTKIGYVLGGVGTIFQIICSYSLSPLIPRYSHSNSGIEPWLNDFQWLLPQPFEASVLYPGQPGVSFPNWLLSEALTSPSQFIPPFSVHVISASRYNGLKSQNRPGIRAVRVWIAVMFVKAWYSLAYGSGCYI